MAVAGDIVIELKLDDKDMSVSVKKAGASLQQFQGTLEQTARSVKRLEDANDSLATKFRNTVMTLGHLRFLMMDINDLFLKLPMAILKSAGEMERLQVLTKGLSKELTEAGKISEGIRDFNFITNMAKRAPFEITAIADSFVKLKNASIDPTNGSLDALINSVARFGGTSETLKRASVAIQQMAGKGVISMEELRQQLGEAVPSAMQDMADGMGVSMSKLAEIVKTGTLEATPAINKMLLQMQINNDGAAAEMMKTWGGSLSNLKTEWSLTAKFIADNGFGQAAKDAVAAVVQAMQSADFRTFAGDAGAALGSAVNGIIKIAKSLIEYREELALLVKGWLAYKVMFSVIAPLGLAMQASGQRTIAMLREESAALMKVGMDRTIAARKAIQDSAAMAEAERLRSVNTIQAKMLEVRLLEVENAKILADHTRLQMAMAAAEARGRGGVVIPGQTGFVGKDKVRTQMQDMSMAMAENSRMMRDNAGEIVKHQAVIGASNIAIAEKTGLLAKMGNGLTLAGAGAMAAAAGGRVLSGVMALMGGPIGIAIAAIITLVWWYGRAAAAAEESADRQRRANSNTSTKDDVKDTQKELKEAEANLIKLRKSAGKNLSGETTSIDGITVDAVPGSAEKVAQIAREGKEINDAIARVASLRDTLEKATISVSEQNSKADADMINMSIDRKLKAFETGTQAEINQIKDNKAKKLAEMKKGTAEYQATQNAFNAAEQRTKLAGVQTRIRAESLAIAELDKSSKLATGDTKTAIDMAASYRRQQREELEKNRDFIENAINTDAAYKPKAPKKVAGEGAGPVVNKIDAFIGNLKEQNKKLGATLPGLLSNLGKADEVVAALAELEQKIENGDFNFNKKDKKTGKVVEMMPDETEKATMRSLVEKNTQFKMLTSDAKKIADEINRMEPDFQQAVKLFADPLGTSDNKQTNKFDELLMRLRAAPGDFKAVAAEMGLVGTSFDALIAKVEEGKTKSMTIDAAKSFKDLADENHKLSLSLIEDDRERARQSAAFDEQRLARVLRDNLRAYTDAKVSTDKIEQYKAEAALSGELRARDLALKMRTPIEVAADNWSKSTKAMEEATASWANQTVDAFVNTAKTGKLQFGSLIESILADMLKIKLQETFAPMIKSSGNAVTNYLSNIIGVGSGSAMPSQNKTPGVSLAYPPADAAAIAGVAEASRQTTSAMQNMVTTGISSSTDGFVQSAVASVRQISTSETTASSLMGLSAASTSAAMAIKTMAASAGTSGVGKAATSAVGTATGGGGGGIWDSISSFGKSAMSSIGSFFGFANGGIMTNMGSMPLRKYAEGGIANSPQLALYGEAGPEAYVPLPDGRSIPVTMSGSLVAPDMSQAAPMVTVNVINQTSQQVGAQQGQPRFDGKQMVLDIVLTAASTPGPFRDGMKGAVGR